MSSAIVLGLLAALIGPATGTAAQPPDLAAGLEARVKTLEEHRALLLAASGSTVIGTAIVLAVGWFRILRRIDKRVRTYVDRIVETYPGAVERIVQEHETEAKLRREARVAVVSDVLRLQSLLREHGFRNLRTILPDDLKPADVEAFAAVVLDLTGGLSEAAARALIEECGGDVFLAYSTGSGRLDLPPGRSTFANSPITLYARLMELLKFQQARESVASAAAR